MSRTVFCVKHQREAEGLDYAPLPGPLGERVYNEIGKPAWAEWMTHQTMLINENRLMPRDPKAREFLAGQLELFLFGTGAPKPPGYVEPE